MENDKNNRKNNEYLQVNGTEFLDLIKKFGYSQRGFAEMIGVSQSFISRSLGLKNEIPWRWTQALKNVLEEAGFAPEAFEIALREIRK